MPRIVLIVVAIAALACVVFFWRNSRQQRAARTDTLASESDQPIDRQPAPTVAGEPRQRKTRAMPATFEDAVKLYPNLARATEAQRARYAFRLTETRLLTTCLDGRVKSGAVRVLRRWRKTVDTRTWELASIEVTPEIDGKPLPPADGVDLISRCLNHDMVGYKRPADDSDPHDDSHLILGDGGTILDVQTTPRPGAIEQTTWAGGHAFPASSDEVYDDLATFTPH